VKQKLRKCKFRVIAGRSSSNRIYTEHRVPIPIHIEE
jgi:hypothetical protein